MAIRYREDKATQAAALLIKAEGGKINHMKLIKLLYLADRTALINWGRPITFDSFVSMDHGPVLSFTLDRINSQPEPEGPSYWHTIISERYRNEVSLRDKDAAPSDQLSPAEEKLLDEIYSKFGKMSLWDLRDYTHTLPEWQKPNGSSTPINVSDILFAEGFDEEDVREVEEFLDANALADSLVD